MKGKRIINSFNYAVAGVIQALKTEPNMKIHFIVAFLVLFMSLFFNFNRIEMLILFFTITMVIVSEMLNTAIEKAVDLITKEYHPVAKIVKDIAAGAVLISALNAIVVGYLLFFERISLYPGLLINRLRNSPIHLTFISIILVILLVVWIKTKTKTGTPFQGGFASGHSAIAFSVATAIAFMTDNALIMTLSYFLAALVAESRVESKIHYLREVIVGSVLGTLVTITIFQVIG